MTAGRRRAIVGITGLVVAWYVVHALGQLIHGDTANNDFHVYYTAARDISAGRDPYFYTLFCCRDIVLNGGYDYPPLLAEMLRPLALLPLTIATRAWLVVNQAALAGACFVAWRLLRGSVSGTCLLALLALTLVFRPVLVTVDLGQVNLVVALLLVAGAYYYARGRQGWWAGAAVAVATVIKPLPGVLAIAFVRGRPRPRLSPAMGTFVATMLVVIGALWVLTPLTSEFVLKVLPRFTSGPSVYGNESLQAVMQRAQIELTGAVQPIGRALTVVAMGALVALTWWRGATVDGRAGRMAVFASFLAVIPLVSSITWDHHLVSEMLVFALLAPSIAPFSGRWWMAAVAYVLLWLPAFPWIAISLLAHAPVLVTVLVAGSMPALGAFLLWLTAYRVLGDASLVAP